jgi:phosphoglycolate phosphatase
MNIILWDIDGTLIRVEKAETDAYYQAVEDLLGSRPEGRLCMNGITDFRYAGEIIADVTGAKPQEKDIIALLRHYEELLPAFLAATPGHAIAPAVEILSALDTNPDYVSLVLTGNSTVAAKAKLDSLDLTKYFELGASAFGDSCYDRSGVAAQALEHIRRRYPDGAKNIFVIGDTPNDIRCGKEIGAKTIGVATGKYSLAELSSHSPWWQVAELPAPAEFLAKLAAK